jgi:fructose-1,6-bisphosphatase/inositol monophosphatase family enzyme
MQQGYDEVRFAATLAVAAGVTLAECLPRKRHVTYKSSIDLLTEMDGASEEFIFRQIRHTFPHDDILSEEGNNRATNSTRRWIVDPLDGTTNYAHGIPLFCVSIALEVEGRIQLGVVFAPMLNELYLARRGYGAFVIADDFLKGSACLASHGRKGRLRFAMPRAVALPSCLVSGGSPGRRDMACRSTLRRHRDIMMRRHIDPSSRMVARPMRVSKVATLSKAMLVTGFPYDVHSKPGSYFKWFRKFCVAAQAVRRLGSAAIDMCYVAAGRIDGFWESKLHAWDTAAAWLIVQEAGGQVTSFSGGHFDIFGTETLASNGLLHSQMIRVLRG